MSEWRRESTADQLAAHLRGELARGRWQGNVPGVIRLAGELGAARNTVEAALRKLERDGLLRGQGQGRGRVISLAGDTGSRVGFRVAILPYEPSDRGAADTGDLIHDLKMAGHVPILTAKTLVDLGHSVKRVARLVREVAADAWVVMAGSRAVLEWFAANPTPVMAYAGRARRLPIASVAPDKVAPLRAAVRRLVALGHHRIVMLVREGRRKPEPGFPERAFLDELKALGISTGPYNLPDWEETIEGFHAGLKSLFRVTPPTALIIDGVPFAVATLQFCLAHGLQVPRDVSILCSDPGPAFDWCEPSIAHLGWDYHPVIRRIVRWANNVSRGKKDLRKTFSKANFVEGGSIGPAKRA